MWIVDATKAVGKTIGAGYDITSGNGISKLTKGGLKSIGKTMAIGGAVGAAVGAGSTLATDGYVDPMSGAAVGAAVGAAAIPAAGAAAGTIGAATIGAGKAGLAVGGAVGKGALAASPIVAAAGIRVASDVGGAAWNMGSKLVRWDKDADSISKVKFTGIKSGFKAGAAAGVERVGSGAIGSFNKFVGNKNAKLGSALTKAETGIRATGGAIGGSIVNGKTMLYGAAAVEGVGKAFNTLQRAKMGQMTGVQTMAP